MSKLTVDHEDHHGNLYEVVQLLGHNHRAIVRLRDGTLMVVKSRHHHSQPAEWVPCAPENQLEETLVAHHSKEET